MAPSASKQKRLAEKAAKQAAKNKGASDASTTNTSTPTGSVYGSSTNTPLTSLSAATSTDDLTSMAKLQIATDRYAHLVWSFNNAFNLLPTGVLLVFSFPIPKVVISRLIPIPCRSTGDFSSKVLRFPSTTVNDTVFWVKTVPER